MEEWEIAAEEFAAAHSPLKVREGVKSSSNLIRCIRCNPSITANAFHRKESPYCASCDAGYRASVIAKHY